MNKKTEKLTIEERINQAIDKIRPSLQADGGDAELVSWDEKKGIAKVRMLGMCSGCPMSQITLKQGIETEVKKLVPEVKEVQAA